MKDNDSTILTKSYPFALSIQRLYLKIKIITGITQNNNLFIIKPVKKQIAFFDGRYVWFKIKKISHQSDTNIRVYNLEVKNDNSYVVENSVVNGLSFN